MSVVLSTVLSAAVSAGAPMIRSLLRRHAGPLGGSLASTVLDAVAKRAGVPVEMLPEVSSQKLTQAVLEEEAEMVAVARCVWSKF